MTYVKVKNIAWHAIWTFNPFFGKQINSYTMSRSFSFEKLIKNSKMIFMSVIISLNVQKADKNDVGHKIARIDYEFMDKLEISSGDVIEIIARNRTVARCKPSFAWEKEKGIIRMDALTRGNAATRIDEPVLVSRIQCPKAKRIPLWPANDVPLGTEKYVRDCLENQPVRFRDKVVLPYFEKKLAYLVLEAEPFPACIVTENTEIIMQKR